MINQLKRIAAALPRKYQQALKRWYFAQRIRRRSFRADEPEFDLASDILRHGDWALDIGANVGQYTLKFSELVGDTGRVVAFEPVPDTLSLLSANVCFARATNVTLINAAASSGTQVLGMAIPTLDTGLDNFYMAHISDSLAGLRVLCLSVDSLALPDEIRLVKIDAEGHDFQVLQGMRGLLERSRPVLFIEDSSTQVIEFLSEFGYEMRKLPNSPNAVFRVVESGQ